MAKTLMQRDPLRRDEPGLHGEQRDSRGSSAPRACAPASTPAAASRTDPSSSRFDRTRRAQSARTGWPLLGRNGVRIVGRRGPGSQFAESSRSPSAAHPIRGELGWWATSWLCARRVGRYSCARCSRISRDPHRTVGAARTVWCRERRLQRNRHRVVRLRARDRAATRSTGCDGMTLAQSQPPQEILESAVLTQDVQARIDVAPQRQPD